MTLSARRRSRTFGRLASARQISTICCSLRLRSPTRRPRVELDMDLVEQRPRHAVDDGAPVGPPLANAVRGRERCFRPPSGWGRAPAPDERAPAGWRAPPPDRCSTTGAPSMRISPLSGAISPFMIESSVDFPAPFSPTNACTSPALTSKVTSDSATTPGNVLRIDLTSSSGATASIDVSPNGSG